MKHTDLPGARVFFTEVGAGTDPYRDNYGAHVPDDPRLVEERRFGLFTQIGSPIVWMNQTHSATVEILDPAKISCYDSGRMGEWGPIESDGIVVDSRQWETPPALAVMTADCMPVLLSSRQGVIGAVHAGRVGFLHGILSHALDAFRCCGVQNEEISMLIGPCICGKCYEVSPQMREESAASCSAIASQTSWGTEALDLPGAALQWARERGVNASWVGECTLDNPAYHSYRRSPECGRFASVIATCRHS